MLKESPDLVIHLGDYIYEYAGRDGRVRKHLGQEIQSIADYRRRIAQYKMDPALQAMHAAAPCIAVTFATGFRFVLPGSNLMYIFFFPFCWFCRARVDFE